MSEEPVDVLIVGAGASGAALAWSLADTRMNILCLEQGDWMDPSTYPSTSSDWELRRFGDFGLSPNSRGRPEDYPINEDGSPISVSNFNAVGGSTILYAAHFPALSSVGLPGQDAGLRGRRLAHRLPAPRALLRAQRSHDGGVGPGRRSRLSPERVPLPPVPLGKLGETLAHGFNRLGWHWWPSDSAIATQELRGARRLHQPGSVHHGLRPGRQGQHGRHLLAGGGEAWRRAQNPVPGARDHRRRRRHGGRRHLLRRRWRRAQAEGRDRGARVQRHRHAAAAPELPLQALPRRPGQPQRPGRQEPDVPSLRHGDRASSRSRWRDTRDPPAAAS